MPRKVLTPEQVYVQFKNLRSKHPDVAALEFERQELNVRLGGIDERILSVLREAAFEKGLTFRTENDLKKAFRDADFSKIVNPIGSSVPGYIVRTKTDSFLLYVCSFGCGIVPGAPRVKRYSNVPSFSGSTGFEYSCRLCDSRLDKRRHFF